MSSITSLVASDGPMRYGSFGNNVRALQLALSAAGYRVDITSGSFTADTTYWVRRFQEQHGLTVDGVVGPQSAKVLDQPHTTIIEDAEPLLHASGWPHDDTASLLDFYGKPWEDGSLLVDVPVPFRMTYTDNNTTLNVKHIRFHKKAAESLAKALQSIADAAALDSKVLYHVQHFSGSYNYRAVRGSSRLSCHAFGAALDFDAERLPLGVSNVAPADMPQAVVDAFDSVQFGWGNRYRGRKDPMHFQAAHE